MLLEDFFLKALAAGTGVAIIAAVLGCFVVWRRMAYFGDSLAHSALLGVALGILTGMDLNLGILIVCTVFALLLLWLQQQRLLSSDTLLGILAHAALSLGMVAISFLEQAEFDLHSYLFGDILTVQNADLWWIYGGGLLVLVLLIMNWSALTLLTLSEDLARAEGVNCLRINVLLMLLMTIVVAISVQIVGILLVTSMLVIPAATARHWAHSPESMAVLASVVGITSVFAGLFASLYLDTPSGPSIVSSAALLFFILATLAAVTGIYRRHSP